MDLRQIRYFVAVAEEGSFTRASKRLHISQPPLSQNIKALEEEMGVTLLIRNQRGVTPTDAGLTLLHQGRRILGLVKDTLEETVRVAGGSFGRIRIGTVSSALFGLMTPVLAELRSQLRDIQVDVTATTSNDILRRLELGELDLGIVHGPSETSKLIVENLYSESMCVAMRCDHPLARRERISLTELAPYDFILFARELSPAYFDSIASLCVRAGFSPKSTHTARDSPTLVRMAALGIGLALVSDGLRNMQVENVCFRPLDDPTVKVGYLLAWNPKETSERIRRVMAVIRQVTQP